MQRLIRWTQGPASAAPVTDSLNYRYDVLGNRLSTKAAAAIADTFSYTSGTSQLLNHTTSPSIGAHVRTDYHYNGNGAMTWRSRTDVTSIWMALGSEEYGYSYRDLLKRYISESSGKGFAAVCPEPAVYSLSKPICHRRSSSCAHHA
ncbi:MAG: hypothetical protein JST22_13320 [Bacteroidetes bacterium]|nr:hypothetical protein [Bacteroidota bacterium]